MNLRTVLQFGARIFLIRRKVVFEATLEDLQRAEPRMPARFRAADHEDLMDLSEDIHDYDPAAKEFALERLRAGDHFTVAESTGSGNKIVFYCWLMFGEMDMGFRRPIELAPDTAYLYKLFTIAAARGRGLAPAYFWLLRELLRQQHMRRVVSWVESRNRISRHVFKTSGFRQIGTIWHIQFLFKTRFFVSPTLRARLRERREGSDLRPIRVKAQRI